MSLHDLNAEELEILRDAMTIAMDMRSIDQNVPRVFLLHVLSNAPEEVRTVDDRLALLIMTMGFDLGRSYEKALSQ